MGKIRCWRRVRVTSAISLFASFPEVLNLIEDSGIRGEVGDFVGVNWNLFAF